MKKILVLVLVFGLASAANAALHISVNGGPAPADSEITLVPSDTIILNIHGDDPADGGPREAYMLIDGPGKISAGDLIYGGGLAAYMNGEELAPAFGVSTEQEVVAQFAEFLAMPTLNDVSYALLADSDIPPNDFLDGTLVDGIIFHCEAEGEVIVTLVDETFGNVLDRVIIHQIPEPLTLSLLGLGGLFLRRRK